MSLSPEPTPAPEAEAHPPRVLVVDPDERIVKAWRVMLEVGEGSPVLFGARDADAARRMLVQQPVDVVIADVRLGASSGLDLLTHIKRTWPTTEVIIMSGHGRYEDAVRATKAGAFDYITKPFVDIGDCVGRVLRAASRKQLNDENVRLRAQSEVDVPELRSANPRMQRLLDRVRRAAPTLRPVLISGPQGSGKSTLARALHTVSDRPKGPYVRVACGYADLPALERALCEDGRAGTVCLEDVDLLPRAVQVGLAHLLDHCNARVCARLVATARRSPALLIDEGDFDEDLYWSLAGVELVLPPLAERREDIPALVHRFVRRAVAEMNRTPPGVDSELMAFLVGQPWAEGNLNALAQAIGQAAVTAAGDTITFEALPVRLREVEGEATALALGELVDLDRPWKDAINRAEHVIRAAYLRGLLERAEGNMTRAAEWAGLDRSNFRRHVKKYLKKEG